MVETVLEVLDSLKRDYQDVIIAVPPIPPGTIASATSDQAVLVAAFRLVRSGLRRCAKSLNSAGSPLAGVLTVQNLDSGSDHG
jgi:hypothetical protein